MTIIFGSFTAAIYRFFLNGKSYKIQLCDTISSEIAIGDILGVQDVSRVEIFGPY